MGGQAVFADTQYNGIEIADLFVQIAEAARFLGAAGRVVARVEVDDNLLPGIVLDRMDFSVAPLQRKCRSLLSLQ